MLPVIVIQDIAVHYNRTCHGPALRITLPGFVVLAASQKVLYGIVQHSEHREQGARYAEEKQRHAIVCVEAVFRLLEHHQSEEAAPHEREALNLQPRQRSAYSARVASANANETLRQAMHEALTRLLRRRVWNVLCHPLIPCPHREESLAFAVCWARARYFSRIRILDTRGHCTHLE